MIAKAPNQLTKCSQYESLHLAMYNVMVPLSYINQTNKFFSSFFAVCSDEGTCGVPSLINLSDFEVFENVQEITGYLVIDEWIFRDLCVFK